MIVPGARAICTSLKRGLLVVVFGYVLCVPLIAPLPLLLPPCLPLSTLTNGLSAILLCVWERALRRHVRRRA